MTSTLSPSPASCSAASSDFCTVAPQVTMVRSRPCADRRGLAERDQVVGRRERVPGVLLAKQVLVLEEQHRVLAAEGGAEQPGGVARARRHDDDEAGDVGEDRLAALGVPDRPAGQVAADGDPDHQRDREAPFERHRVVAASVRICSMAGQM